jgi:hypothetical protein
MRMVQDKVNAYLAFVESGQLLRVASPPIPASPMVQIELIAAYAPPDAAQAILRRIGDVLAGLCIRFDVVVREMR